MSRTVCRHWKMAECSESTGTISAPYFCAVSMTSSPAQTNVSLFASAIRFPARIAASVGLSPATPTTAVTTVPPMVAASVSAAAPPATRIFVSASRTAKSSAAVSSAIATMRGLNFRACSSMRFTSEFAVKASTFRPSASATSSVCRPMEPVEPSTDRVLFIIRPPLFFHPASSHLKTVSRHRNSISKCAG